MFGKEEMKKSAFMGKMIMCIENPTEPTDNS